MELTKNSKKLICLLYKDYLKKRKAGLSKTISNSFGSSHNIHERLCPNWIFEDVDNTCRELSRAGMLNCLWADDIACLVQISDSGIIYMENRSKNGLLGVIKFISEFKPW